MPYRKPKRSYVLPVVTTLAVAAPLAALVPSDSDYRTANETQLAAVPAQLAEVVLNSAPDIVLPLRELTGLNLPDLRLSDLRRIPLPASVPVPPGLPLPPGIQLPSEIPLPQFDASQPSAPQIQTVPGRMPTGAQFIADPGLVADPNTPALAPGAVPPELMSEVGAQVKELSRDTPFSVVALTADDLLNTKAMIRAKQPDGTWGPWYEAEPLDTGAADNAAPNGTEGTEPIYVGNTTAVQVLVTRKPAPAAAPQDHGAPIQPTPAAAPADQPQPELKAVLIDPGRGAIDGSLNDVAAALPGGGPTVITRSQWGADESIRCDSPTYDDGLGGVTVHHTAGRNDYSKAESAGIVRAIYTYHAQTLGWCDIGYHALVDKYGQIFEGRFGGLDKAVQGAHAGGFNENTSGVAMMGNYESETPSTPMINAVGRFVGWRTKVAGLDPKGYTTMYSEGTEYTPYAQGEEVRLPIVFAHRDVGNTSCPGDAAYAMMDRIRDIAAGAPGASGSTPPSRQVQSDVAALANLTAKLLTMVNDNIIAKYWASKGGPDGPLGQAASEPMPAAQGQQYAKFVNGYVYSTPDGQAIEVVGKILDRFLELGADAGVLGLPLGNSYPVPDGLREDFQYGSLILNQVTGIVTTVWKTYNDTYQEEMNKPDQVSAPGSPAPAPGAPMAPAPVPAEGQIPAPADAQVPAPAPAEAQAPAPAPADTQTPAPAPADAQAPAPGTAPGSEAPAPAPAPEAVPSPAPPAPAPAPETPVPAP
ncbi:N-acetylmuramoyl-L-alanine amidase [Nocardia cyriacigeorgica]|uniref:N-acetylmuramoyl-L-alanine amidase n=2 Tax=Nocardia TaxID=1817 RepID=UPI001892E02D|nr:N-acetylmuramoyl-L-alanine amidase [Nocardia cyriacigeorgica]MBF6286622.1 N-acetylmuramoyl-L-alanine amidase [Nocardia cyriacigeorgica]